MTTTNPMIKNRRGVFLLDVAVGFVITGAVLVVLLQAVFQLSDHRLDRRTRQIAVDTLLNVNEMLDFSAPPAEMELEPLREMVARTLADGELTVTELPNEQNDIALLRIAVSYNEGANRPKRIVHLIRAFDILKTDGGSR